jgi:hypothetical protein
MSFQLTCLLCEGTKPHTSKYLVPMQEHVMTTHGYTQTDLQKQTKRETDAGYIYTMPDGKDWLDAARGGNYIGGGNV